MELTQYEKDVIVRDIIKISPLANVEKNVNYTIEELENCFSNKDFSPIINFYENVKINHPEFTDCCLDTLSFIDGITYRLNSLGNGVIEVIKKDNSDFMYGDYLNPITFTIGITVEKGLFYTDGDNIWECIKSGTPIRLNEKEFFDIILAYGDYLNPIEYKEGMEVQAWFWYTDKENIWEAIKDGIPASFSDSEYFEIINI